MSDLKILIHNLADLAPDYDRRHHYRVVDIMVEHWSEQHYITYNYAEKNFRFKSAKIRLFSKTDLHIEPAWR